MKTILLSVPVIVGLLTTARWINESSYTDPQKWAGIFLFAMLLILYRNVQNRIDIVHPNHQPTMYRIAAFFFILLAAVSPIGGMYFFTHVVVLWGDGGADYSIATVFCTLFIMAFFGLCAAGMFELHTEAMAKQKRG